MELDMPDTTAELLDHPKYRKLKDINRGAFGVVVLAEDRRTGEQCAIKFIKRGSKVTKYVLREILNHRSLIHPHIVQFKEVFLTKGCLATAMEYCNGGDMLDYVVKRGGLPEASSRWFFQQLISAVDYLHKMGFASRDIKLDNVLLDGSRRPLMKLCDFGYSKHERDSAPGSTVGTPAYLAPEVIRASEKDPYDAKLADIWSCGVFLYAATIGTYPFYRPQDRGNPREVQLMIQRILRLQYRIPENGEVSDSLRDLLSKILVDDPQKRISMKEIQRHPWYLEDLPEGVADMNDELPLPGDDVQPLNLVERVIYKAQKPVQEVPRRANTGPSLGRKIIPPQYQTALPQNPAVSQPRSPAQRPKVATPSSRGQRPANSALRTQFVVSPGQEKEHRSRLRSRDSASAAPRPVPQQRESAASKEATSTSEERKVAPFSSGPSMPTLPSQQSNRPTAQATPEKRSVAPASQKTSRPIAGMQEGRSPEGPPTPDRREPPDPRKETGIVELQSQSQTQPCRSSPSPVQPPIQTVKQSGVQTLVSGPTTQVQGSSQAVAPAETLYIRSARPSQLPSEELRSRSPHHKAYDSAPQPGRLATPMQSVAALQTTSDTKGLQTDQNSGSGPSRKAARENMQQDSGNAEGQGVWSKFCSSCARGKGRGRAK